MTSDSREVRCPNCSRLTPLAPFCTHCGALIPEGASAARPRAMDRGELEARIRQRRGVESPYLRGEPSADTSSASPAWRSPQEPSAFVPEASDELARHEAEGAAEIQRVDYLDERSPSPTSRAADPVAGVGGIPGAAYSAAAAEWPSVDGGAGPGQPDAADVDEAHGADIPEGPVAAPPAALAFDAPEHQPTDVGDGGGYGREERLDGGAAPAGDYAAPARAAGYGAAASGGYASHGEFEYTGDAAQPFGSDAGARGDGRDGGDGRDWGGRDWTPYNDAEPPRRSSATLTIIGFVVLGAAALVGGALLFSALNVPAGVASQSSTPSPTEQASASASESAGESTGPSTGASAGASSSSQPDNFSATTQPCATRDMGFKGCDVNGSKLDRGQVWVWVGFKNGTPDNLIGVTIVSKSSNASVADGSLTLDQLSGCNPGKTCSGYIQMVFDNLNAGDYTIQVTRDGDQVATSDFSVKS